MNSGLKAIRSRAVIFEELGAPLAIREIMVDPPGPGEVLVKVTGAGLCHSDLNILSGHTRYNLPMVMGHEGVGIVKSIGAGVNSLKPRQRVVLSWGSFCGDCFFCSRGETELCGEFSVPRGTGVMPAGGVRFKETDGSMIHHLACVSSLSEYTVVPESGCVVIGDDIKSSVASTVGCSVVTGLGSVFNTADLPESSTMLVIGAGSIGMMIIQGAKIRGASVIAVLEPDKSKWPMAKLLGATDIFDNTQGTPFEEISKLTASIGLDFVFDAVTTRDTIQDSVKMVRRGGTVVLVGSPHPLMVAELPMVDFHLETKLIGSLYGSANPQIDIPKILDYYRDGSLALDELIFSTFKMDNINEAIEALKVRGGKYLIQVEQ